MRSYGILLRLSLKNTLASFRTGVTSRKTGKISIGYVLLAILGCAGLLGLAVALAVYSTCTGRKLDSRTLVLGEIGLTGDLRAVQNAEKIIREAERLGFERVVLPIKNARHIKSKPDINVIGLKNIAEARNLF